MVNVVRALTCLRVTFGSHSVLSTTLARSTCLVLDHWLCRRRRASSGLTPSRSVILVTAWREGKKKKSPTGDTKLQSDIWLHSSTCLTLEPSSDDNRYWHLQSFACPPPSEKHLTSSSGMMVTQTSWTMSIHPASRRTAASTTHTRWPAKRAELLESFSFWEGDTQTTRGSRLTFLSGLADSAFYQMRNLRPHDVCESF